jgi:wyosine [tRNA(Phe)-imidazoG37] synthetase (radical SAM superfamily)
MDKHHYKYIYGPVSSWRLGKSLGVDPISSGKKTCSFDCVYCQAGSTEEIELERKVFVPTHDLISELQKVPSVPLDFITFAGNGEPTLAKNLGDMIREIRKIRPEKIAVITNAARIDREDVQKDLALADVVVAKMDACNEDALYVINHPASGILFRHIFEGLKSFRKMYKGQLALQVMFVKANRGLAKEIAKLAVEIAPDEVELNTPLRASKEMPLSPAEMETVTKAFRETCGKIPVKSVYEMKREKSSPFCQHSTEMRRGKETG